MKSLESRGAATTGLDIGHAAVSWLQADAVCFDVDSTVIGEEGIDVLADYLGQGEAVAALTRAAMDGPLPFEVALQQRLDLLQPARDQILACMQARPFHLTAGIATLVETLHACQIPVFLVSGGFRIMIEPIADQLNIPRHHIIANTILFNDAGQYRGFDTTELTSRDMGKPAALQSLYDQHHYRTMVMVGDGATDLQAKPPATSFIGFGGVVRREKVANNADWFITEFDTLTWLLQTHHARYPAL
jgi:phosphoserine phosphatase